MLNLEMINIACPILPNGLIFGLDAVIANNYIVNTNAIINYPVIKSEGLLLFSK